MKKYGSKIKVGDTLVVWWRPGRDTIKSLTDYNGPYKQQREFIGSRIAEFTFRNLGMTILSGDVFEVVK
jgi:hypothetical protein